MLIELFLHWYACCAEGRSLGRVVFRMGRLLHFLTHVAALARFARESSAKILEYQRESTKYFGDFSKILFFPRLVDIYRHPLLMA